VERLGYVVSLTGQPQRAVRLRDTEITFLTAHDLASVGFSSASGDRGDDGSSEERTDEAGGSGSAPSVPPPPSAAAGVTKDEVELRSRAASETRVAIGTHIPSPTDTAVRVDGQSAPASKAQALQPQAGGTGVEVELGLSVSGEAVTWRPSVRGSPHLFTLGIPGQGKSWTIMRLLRALSAQGVGFLVIDFHGQFQSIDERGARDALPLVVDAATGLPFSPLEADGNPASGASYWRTNCFAVAEIIQYVCGLGDIQRDVVYEAIRDCYRNGGFESDGPHRLPTIQDVYTRLSEVEQERGVRNVVPRCRSLFEFGLFRDDGPNASLWSLQRLTQGGVIVDMHSIGLEELQRAGGAFLLRKIYKEMFGWGEVSDLRFAIVLDEAHRLAKDMTLPKLMKEGRKFGIAVVVASQSVSDFHPDVLGNAGTKVVFRTNFPMSRKVAGYLRAGRNVDVAAAVEQLEVGEAFVQTPEMNTATRVRMHPLAR
jgi:DNA phosphorothioation-dependent restriction protein DptH